MYCNFLNVKGIQNYSILLNECSISSLMEYYPEELRIMNMKPIPMDYLPKNKTKLPQPPNTIPAKPKPNKKPTPPNC